MCDNGEIVRNKQVGQSTIALQITQQVHDLGLHTDIERRHRFIAHNEARFNRECARNTYTLTLPAAELVRISRSILGAQANFFQQRADTRVGGRPFRELVHNQPFTNRGTNRHARIERTVRILKDDLHAASQLSQRFAFKRQHVHAFECDSAGRGLNQTQQCATGGCFATAGFTNECQRLAAVYCERHAVHRFHLACHPSKHARSNGKMFREIVHREQRCVSRGI